MTFELVVIWETGEKEVHSFDSKEAAKEAESGYKMAFGRQIQWTGIRKAVD